MSVEPRISQEVLERLRSEAWRVREYSYCLGGTRVGAALWSIEEHLFGGCNVEHRFRSHDIHAEVSAIARMIGDGDTRFLAMVVAAEREQFTPCGACMDWIMQFGGPQCYIGYEPKRDSGVKWLRADTIMPVYPR